MKKLELTPVILATQEAEIRRIVGSKPTKANSSARPYLKKTLQIRAGGVAQGVGPEVKPQYHNTTNKKNYSGFKEKLTKSQTGMKVFPDKLLVQ
jgi:hypothetical protein